MRTSVFVRAASAALLFWASALMAQDAPGLRKGNAELGAFGGASLGLDSWRSTGGVNYAHAVHNDVLVYGEYNYLPGFSRSFPFDAEFARTPSNPTGKTIRVNVPWKQRIHDINFGIHYRLPKAESQFVPYLAAGFGTLTYPKVTAKFAYEYDIFNGPNKKSFEQSFDADTTLAANFGGGIRYYFTKHFAIRFEVKAYKGFNEPKNRIIKNHELFMRSVVGLVYQMK
jgi:hypothetical protein